MIDWCVATAIEMIDWCVSQAIEMIDWLVSTSNAMIAWIVEEAVGVRDTFLKYAMELIFCILEPADELPEEHLRRPHTMKKIQ